LTEKHSSWVSLSTDKSRLQATNGEQSDRFLPRSCVCTHLLFLRPQETGLAARLVRSRRRHFSELFPTRLRRSRIGFGYNLHRATGIMFPNPVDHPSALTSLAIAIETFTVATYGFLPAVIAVLPKTGGRPQAITWQLRREAVLKLTDKIAARSTCRVSRRSYAVQSERKSVATTCS
jgi:hypothetical protein